MLRTLRYMVVLVAMLALLPATSATRAAGAAVCAGSYDVTALANGPGNELLMGTRDGHVFRSTDGGRCWALLGILPAAIEIGTLLAPPSASGVLIAGGSYLVSLHLTSFRLYRSADGGRTWLDGTRGLPHHTPIMPAGITVSARGMLVLSYLCQHDVEVGYAARTVACPHGLARSLNDGRSWQVVGPTAASTTERGVVTLADGSLLAAQALQGKRQVIMHTYRSHDDGLTWQPLGVLPGEDRAGGAGNLSLLFAVPWDTRQVLAGYGIQNILPLVFRSTDGGATFPGVWQVSRSEWKPFVDIAPIAFVALIHTHTLLLTDVGYIYRSRDGGRTWSRAHISLPRDKHIWAMLADPDGRAAYAGTSIGVYRSTNDGQTWQPAS